MNTYSPPAITSLEEVSEEETSLPPMQVESQDIPPPESNSPTSLMKSPLFLQQLWQNHLQPARDAVTGCTTTAYLSCVGSSREELEWQLPALLKDVRGRSTKPRTIALQKLYRLTDREHRENRVPAVCTTKFETVQSLVTALGENVPHSDRRQALLILNNLCIPTENKAAILFGEPAEPLLNTLLSILRHRLAESYLAAVTLLNLSYLQDDHAKTMLFTYVPIPDEQEDAIETYSHQLPVDNPISLIRTLESVLKEFVGYVGQQPKPVVYSVEQQCCRWSMNVIRNLVTVPEHALTVGTKTVIPAVAAECLSHADTACLSRWTRDSLEDACLMLLVHVCQRDECLDALKDNERLTSQVIAVCENLETSSSGDGVVSIHQTRAAALLERFEEATASARSVGYSV